MLAKIHPLAHKAWQAHAYYEKLDMSDRVAEDTWRRDVLQKISGQRSSKNLSMEQFEEAMLEFAMTAQEDKEIAYWSLAKERRYRYQVNRFMQLLSVVRAEVTSWSYVRSIMDRMNLAERLDDVPLENLQDIIAALDTHFRRLCRECGLKPADVKAVVEQGNKEQIRIIRHQVEHHKKEFA